MSAACVANFLGACLFDYVYRTLRDDRLDEVQATFALAKLNRRDVKVTSIAPFVEILKAVDDNVDLQAQVLAFRAELDASTKEDLDSLGSTLALGLTCMLKFLSNRPSEVLDGDADLQAKLTESQSQVAELEDEIRKKDLHHKKISEDMGVLLSRIDEIQRQVAQPSREV